MAQFSQTFVAKAAEYYPQESALHAAIAAGDAEEVCRLIYDVLYERDQINHNLFSPSTALQKLNELGEAKFKEWLEGNDRVRRLERAWRAEVRENPVVAEESGERPDDD